MKNNKQLKNNFLKSSIIIMILFQIGIINHLSAQNDTIYYNSKWQRTVSDSASFFRPPIKKEGNLFRVQDYYIGGTLQMNGLSKSSEKDIWQGEVTWYNKDGSVYQQGNYTDGRLDGEFVTNLNGKQLVAKYKNSRYVAGQQNISCGGGMYLYTRQKGDTTIATMYGKDIEGLRYETYRLTKGRRGDLFTKYYAADGSYIGKRSIGTNGYTKGIEVDYYRSPMRIREIRTYDDQGYVFASDYYYPNGQLREKFEEKELKRTYFTEEGKLLGELFYQMDRGKLKSWNGRHLYFYPRYGDDKSTAVQSIRDYEDGKVVYEELRYENQALKSKVYYKNGSKEKLITFDETGKEIGSIEYENYLPVNGIEILGDRKSVYKDGVLVAETNYYPKTKMVFSEKKAETETFYDKEGAVLGTLTYDTTENYPKPFQGKKFTSSYEGEITSIEEYKNGFITKRTSFRKRIIGENKKSLTFKNIEFYEENGYERIKTAFFYSNGAKQHEIAYKKYNKTNGTFYDERGKLIGTYSYLKKDGTLYEFFADSDEVRLMEERVNGKLLKSKVYTYGPDRKYGNIDAVLIEKVDVDCCATYYDTQGGVIAKCTFKDRKPWEGTLYDSGKKAKYTLSEGKRNGPYQKLDYNFVTILEEGQFEDDKEEGLFNYYDYQTNLIRTENYTNGQLNGLTVYYDIDGKILAELRYENGRPIEGVKISKAYSGLEPTKETYLDGELIKKTSVTENGRRVTTYENGQEKQTIAYYPDSNKKRLSYTVENGYLEGPVINYDTNGEEKHRAILKKGKLKEGTVYLTGDAVNGRPAYVVVTRDSGTLRVTFMGENEKVLFTAEEKLAFGTNTVFMQGLNIYMDYLGPDRLY